ncbi:MAG: hypothetical protein WCC36_05005 [Gammaproteobacteria bacterium]
MATKLLADSPELISMWRTLEQRRSGSDDLWVWAFLQAAADASTLPRFHFKPPKERKELSAKISRLAHQLARDLERNGLDGHLIHTDGAIFNGFYIYEDFEEANRARIDAAGNKKLKISKFLNELSEWVACKITEEPTRGKAGKNAQAIRFVRRIAARNSGLYKTPLNAVIAAAVNAIFGTTYDESDIVKLVKR